MSLFGDGLRDGDDLFYGGGSTPDEVEWMTPEYLSRLLDKGSITMAGPRENWEALFKKKGLPNLFEIREEKAKALRHSEAVAKSLLSAKAFIKEAEAKAARVAAEEKARAEYNRKEAQVAANLRLAVENWIAKIGGENKIPKSWTITKGERRTIEVHNYCLLVSEKEAVVVEVLSWDMSRQTHETLRYRTKGVEHVECSIGQNRSLQRRDIVMEGVSALRQEYGNKIEFFFVVEDY